MQHQSQLEDAYRRRTDELEAEILRLKLQRKRLARMLGRSNYRLRDFIVNQDRYRKPDLSAHYWDMVCASLGLPYRLPRYRTVKEYPL